MPSNADLVRSAIERANSEKKDLTKSSIRQEVVDKIVSENEHLKDKKVSLQATFSDILRKQIKSQGGDPDSYKKKTTPKFDNKLKSSKEAKPVTATRPTGYNPALENAPDQQVMNPEPHYHIQEKQVQEMANGLWEVIRAWDGNIPKLDKEESASVSGMWTPIIEDSITTKRQLLAITIPSTAGLAIRKIREGRKITKARKEQKIIEQKEKEMNHNQKQQDKKEVKAEPQKEKVEYPHPLGSVG